MILVLYKVNTKMVNDICKLFLIVTFYEKVTELADYNDKIVYNKLIL